MNLIDILILNISIVDLVLYPVLFILVVLALVRNNNLSKKVNLLLENQENTHDLTPKDDLAISAANAQTEPSDDIMLDQYDIPSFKAEGNSKLTTDIKPAVSDSPSLEAGSKAPKPDPVSKSVYVPSDEVADISDEDARAYILKKVTGPIGDAIKKFPENWEFTGLIKKDLQLLFNTCKHYTDKDGERVTKKLYYLLNPGTSKS